MSGFVYLACDGNESGPCKIGFTENPRSRIKTLRSTSGIRGLKFYELWEFPNRGQAKEMEVLALGYMKRYHSHGEWFDANPILAKERLNHAFYMTRVFDVDDDDYCPAMPQAGLGLIANGQPIPCRRYAPEDERRVP